MAWSYFGFVELDPAHEPVEDLDVAVDWDVHIVQFLPGRHLPKVAEFSIIDGGKWQVTSLVAEFSIINGGKWLVTSLVEEFSIINGGKWQVTSQVAEFLITNGGKYPVSGKGTSMVTVVLVLPAS